MNINSVAICKVCVTTEMGKYLFIKTAWSENLGENSTKHKNGRNYENGRFHFPRRRMGDGSQKRVLPARNRRLNRSATQFMIDALKSFQMTILGNGMKEYYSHNMLARAFIVL